MRYFIEQETPKGLWRSEAFEGSDREACQCVTAGFLLGHPRRAVEDTGRVVYALDAKGTDVTSNARRFILWDPTDGEPARGENGEVVTSGCMGVIPESSVYLRTYAQWPDARRPADRAYVGDRIRGVVFALSGERGVYDVVRVA